MSRPSSPRKDEPGNSRDAAQFPLPRAFSSKHMLLNDDKSGEKDLAANLSAPDQGEVSSDAGRVLLLAAPHTPARPRRSRHKSLRTPPDVPVITTVPQSAFTLLLASHAQFPLNPSVFHNSDLSNNLFVKAGMATWAPPAHDTAREYTLPTTTLASSDEPAEVLDRATLPGASVETVPEPRAPDKVPRRQAHKARVQARRQFVTDFHNNALSNKIFIAALSATRATATQDATLSTTRMISLSSSDEPAQKHMLPSSSSVESTQDDGATPPTRTPRKRSRLPTSEPKQDLSPVSTEAASPSKKATFVTSRAGPQLTFLEIRLLLTFYDHASPTKVCSSHTTELAKTAPTSEDSESIHLKPTATAEPEQSRPLPTPDTEILFEQTTNEDVNDTLVLARGPSSTNDDSTAITDELATAKFAASTTNADSE
ncbi:hypothetical protein MIND_01129700 [Mycena indigotica]|uniref:Uncharacterized protein n=1 Tax=Mycena indigotica TaxID=2126181 RepID=A0A8H6VZ78_9AGAR|nr:uncharacterized protein MIND_01129700 [Mycena indigotica]KAF7293514.1 hypothetical protein MIND_01129700 [Mycena indigotica]